MGPDDNHRAYRFHDDVMHQAAKKEVMETAFSGNSHPDE
jgi:hypothetical protein